MNLYAIRNNFGHWLIGINGYTGIPKWTCNFDKAKCWRRASPAKAMATIMREKKNWNVQLVEFEMVESRVIPPKVTGAK